MDGHQGTRGRGGRGEGVLLVELVGVEPGYGRRDPPLEAQPALGWMSAVSRAPVDARYLCTQ